MPLISPDDDQMTLSGQRGSIPQPQADTSSVFDLLDAAARRSNLAGTVTERVLNPKPSAPAVPGFDPSVSVPKGYEPVADIFAGATSPQDIEWRRQQYDREQQANQIIAAHHGWGLAASMAFGAVDPVTLASMAIPGGGETRLIQAGRTALAAGIGSAAQEVGMQALEVSRTPEESALNIAASTVLGGVLGGVLRPHVPKAEFTEIADRYHQELHGEGGETVMGPMDGRQRIIPETDVKVKPVAERTGPDLRQFSGDASRPAAPEGSVQESGSGFLKAAKRPQPARPLLPTSASRRSVRAARALQPIN
jgi:hypothetical protein